MFYHAKKRVSTAQHNAPAKTHNANNQKKPIQGAYKIGQFIKAKNTKSKNTNPKYLWTLDYNQQANGIIHPKEIRKWLNGNYQQNKTK
jgi:hypothetical protein